MVLAAVLSRLYLYDALPTPLWDETVYLMMGKYFAGEHIYFEYTRPPLYPLTLSLFSNSGFIRLIPIVFSILLTILTYILARKLFGRRVAAYSAFFVVANPLIIEWTPRFLTEIPATCILLASLIILSEGVGKNNKLCFYVSVVLSSLTFLMKYPMGLALPIVYVTYFIYYCRWNLRKFLFSREVYFGLIVFSLPIIPWLAYINGFNNPLTAFKLSLMWSSKPTYPAVYVKNVLTMFSFELILIAAAAVFLLRQRAFEENMWFIITPIIILSGFFQFFVHREPRYMISIVPFTGTFVSVAFTKYVKKSVWSRVYPILLLSSFISANAYMYLIIENACRDKTLESAGNLLKRGESGVVVSTVWPMASYYSSMPAIAFPEDQKTLEALIIEQNVSYIIASDRDGWPDYAKNKGFYDGVKYLTELGSFDEGCRETHVYVVNKTLLG